MTSAPSNTGVANLPVIDMWAPIVNSREIMSHVADHFFYGTGAFLINRPPSELVAELKQLPVPTDVLADWLYGNAARLLNLE